MTTTRLALYAALGALCVYATPSIAGAQDNSSTSGFFIGGSYERNGVAFEDLRGAEVGFGYGVILGYGFTPKLALYAQASSASDNSIYGKYGPGHFDSGLRVHFRSPARTLVPFIQAGISLRALIQEFGLDTVKLTGAGVAFGGGINVHVNPAVAFSTGVTWSAWNVDNFRISGSAVPVDSLTMTTARIHFGMVWFVQSK
jgi:hypothetical protein